MLITNNWNQSFEPENSIGHFSLCGSTLLIAAQTTYNERGNIVRKRCLLYVLIICAATVCAWGRGLPTGEKPDTGKAPSVVTSETDATSAPEATPTSETVAAAETQAPAPAETPAAAPAKPAALPPIIYLQMKQMAEVGKKYDSLLPNNWQVPINSQGNTLLGDEFGIRAELAKVKTSLYIDTTTMFVADMRNKLIDPGGSNSSGQAYMGQAPNYVENTFAILTYNPTTTTQFVFSATQNTNNWVGTNGPQFGAKINGLYINQLFLNKQLRVTAGWMTGEFVYVGIFTGGNLAAGTLGIKAVLPFEVGVSCCLATVPAINIRYETKSKWYDMFAVQRSMDPAGSDQEAARSRTGLRFLPKGDGAKALYINEFGIDRKSGLGQKAIWARADGFANFSAYQNESSLADVMNGVKTHSGAMSFAIDAQLTQPDKRLPFRGLYINSMFQWATPESNPYQAYYQIAAYIKGPFKTRPLDAVFFNAYRMQFSRKILTTLSTVNALHGLSPFVYDDSTQGSVTYAYFVKPGAVLAGNVAVINHPQFGPGKLPTAVDGFLALKVWF